MGINRASFSGVILTSAVLTLLAFPAYGQYSYENRPAISLFEELQETTSYRFLYRESLVSDLDISLDATDETLIEELKKALQRNSLTLQVDENRKQAIILKSGPESLQSQEIRISGQVVDASTGERLPFATVFWNENESTKGVSTGSAGTFSTKIQTSEASIDLNISYVGYQQNSITINAEESRNFEDVTIRLAPKSVSGSEILVTGTGYYSPQDSSLTGLIRTERFSPLGEGNAIRALQILPSVPVTTALNDGLNVRGSSADGFQVELDGMAIFNQSHLFGLLDSFNEDAIQNSGFFYDVAPAQIQAPTGGTLSLLTKTGSLNRFQATGGVSNSSFKSTLSGPVKNGRSSWMLSGRASYMDQISWFNNSELIQWGLDIDRPSSADGTITELDSRLVTPGNSDAFFYDLHGKLYFEAINGSRTMASVYIGGDETEQRADRLMRNPGGETRFSEETVITKNRWANITASVKHQRPITRRIYSHTIAGISAYETSFSKDDFIYTRFSQTGDTRQISVFTYPLLNRSTMNQLKADQSFDLDTDIASFTAGFAGFYHRGEYLEESFDRTGFFSRTEAFQADAYLQGDKTLFNFIELRLGARGHYYSEGDYWAFSPRTKIILFPNRSVSFSAGYSRNHQFLHRIGFSNVVTADIWVLSNKHQPPSEADHYSAGIYLRGPGNLYIQAEGYMKEHKRLRLHEINTQTLTNTFSDSPWFSENEGFGRGLELLLRKSFSPFTLTQTYTLSSMELRNDAINNGERFYADWDRTHSATTMLEIPVFSSLDIFASWMMASGTPNRIFSEADIADNNRLDDYYRLDLSALYSTEIKNTGIEAKFSFFNVLNRNNSWYNEYRLAIESGRAVPVIRPITVEVYDLGFQPSFELKVVF